MNNQYKDINFNAFGADRDCILTDTEKKNYISNFYKSAGLQKQKKREGRSARGIGYRRGMVMAAVMVLIMAFSAVAYAAGWFNPGVIHTKDETYELIVAEDSAQYKAAKEVIEYENSLSKEELAEQDNGAFEDLGQTNEREKSITYGAPSKMEQKIIDKYGLEAERTHYYVNSAKKALEKVGAHNILGDFWDIDALESKDDYVYDDGYIYTDKGSATIMGGSESSDIYWELKLIPNNVYISPRGFLVPPYAKEEPEYQEWDFGTKEGYHVKATSFREETEELHTGEKGTSRSLSATILTNTHTVLVLYSVDIANPKQDLSKKDFQALINKLDLSKLH